MRVNRYFDESAHADIESAEILLLRLMEDFSLYCERLELSHTCVEALLARRKRGFSNSNNAALYEQIFTSAIHDYSQLLEQLIRVNSRLFLVGNVAAWTV